MLSKILLTDKEIVELKEVSKLLLRLAHETNIDNKILATPQGVGPMEFSRKEIQEAAWLCEYLSAVKGVVASMEEN